MGDLAIVLPREGCPQVSCSEMELDVLLVRRCRDGDVSAFNGLFQRHQASVLRLCIHLLGNQEDAEDAAQETFVRAHRALHTFRAECRFSTWLTRIAINTCRTEMRRRSRRPTTELADWEWAALPDEGARVDEALNRQLDRQQVQSVLEQLSEKYREVIVLRHFHEMTYDEIGETLQWSLEKVKVTLHRARQAFKSKYLAAQEDEGKAL